MTMDFNNPNDNWNYDPCKGMNEKERIKTALAYMVVYFIGFAVAVAMCALLSGCTTTQYIERWHTKTDTLRVTQHQRDSLYFCDSIYTIVRTEGDTVFLTTDRWRIRYVERTRTDTLYQSRTDSIPYPVEVEKEVPAQLTWWQQTRIHLANIMMWLLAAVCVIWIVRTYLKNRLPH